MVYQFTDFNELSSYLSKIEHPDSFLRLSKVSKDRFLVDGNEYDADYIEALMQTPSVKTHKYEKGDILMWNGTRVRVVDYGWDDELTLWYECTPADFVCSITREFKEEDLCRV